MVHINKNIVIAGHLCLDIIPDFSKITDVSRLFKPGNLSEVGALSFHTGGSVANTGLSLEKLGFSTTLVGKIGNDYLGDILKQELERFNPQLQDKIKRVDRESTSYSIVLSPPNMDRVFFHSPGTNQTFTSNDLPEDLSGEWFHFGYPPLMKGTYLHNGKELVEIFKKAKVNHMMTSLDMAMPEKDAIDKAVKWDLILEKTLKYVDVFMPSLDEMIELLALPDPMNFNDLNFFNKLSQLATKFIQWGCPIVGFKLGEYGLYLKTGSRFSNSLDPKIWANRELYAPCFETKVVGTTGAGDATFSGLIAGMLSLDDPRDIVNAAVATGAFSVTQKDAILGIPDRESILKKVFNPVLRLQKMKPPKDWSFNNEKEIWERRK